MIDVLYAVFGFGCAIMALQVLAIVVYWRKGSKYARMERAHREVLVQLELAARSRANQVVSDDFDIAWYPQADLDDSAAA